MKNDSRPVAALSSPVAALSSDSRRLVAHSRTVENSLSLVPAVHLVPLVKGRNNESSPKLPFYTARLIVYVDRAIVFSIQSFFLRSATRQLNKQTKRIVRLNDSTFPYKRNETKPKRNGTITLYCLIGYVHTFLLYKRALVGSKYVTIRTYVSTYV